MANETTKAAAAALAEALRRDTSTWAHAEAETDALHAALDAEAPANSREDEDPSLAPFHAALCEEDPRDAIRTIEEALG